MYGVQLVTNAGSIPFTMTLRRICCHIPTGTRSTLRLSARCSAVLLGAFARLLLNILNVNLHSCGKLAVPLLTAAACLARLQTVAQVQNAVLIIRNWIVGRYAHDMQYYYTSHYLQVRRCEQRHGMSRLWRNALEHRREHPEPILLV